MKYHYMRISPTTVRIELIPEDNTEKMLLQDLAQSEPDNQALTKLFENGLGIYQSNTKLLSKKFMEFPRVALCSFETVTQLSDVGMA
ncbi:hypothetical protein [Pedobacter ureilyticus]|jgi:uncharacterized pyridoxamine 5'-phosphate oxidase family protein|uniref:Uncharacterized protein n=1 Tax=Pedobacter ureilyticus TaxID=1393051 RepID=A0ABW9JAS7_9SPHI|nr:hypothetical protein [Pedobacter helvus]